MASFPTIELGQDTPPIAFIINVKNIQVNALGPGSLHTRMSEELRNGAQRIGDTALYELGQRVTSGGGASIEQVAALAVFLGSEAAGPLSGRLISTVTDDVPHLPA
jgi:NAD(P)-dependent dehydrogenase (short-subunit alcohol dehydrogenase family)